MEEKYGLPLPNSNEMLQRSGKTSLRYIKNYLFPLGSLVLIDTPGGISINTKHN